MGTGSASVIDIFRGDLPPGYSNPHHYAYLLSHTNVHAYLIPTSNYTQHPISTGDTYLSTLPTSPIAS